jgi:hypothetical protein
MTEDITAICNRLHREINHTIRAQHARGYWAGYARGVLEVCVVLLAAAAVTLFLYFA